MKKGKKVLTQQINSLKKIKVKLDHRTMIVINDISALKVWKKRFPQACIIS